MKTLFIIIILIIGLLFLAKISHYSERMEYINAHQCAVLGYEPDCKTKLK